MSNQTKKIIESPAEFIGVEGNDIISFGSGQPDLAPPEHIFAKLSTKRLLKYGLIQGDYNLRQRLTNSYPNSQPDDFVITNGASEALDLTLRAIYQQHGSVKVLLFKPYYYSYPELVKMAGLTPVYSNLEDGRINMADVKKLISDVKVVVINSPSNPTGRIESLDTLRQIEQLTVDNGTYVISDEVYKDLMYKRDNYLIKGPHVITLNSFSKTYSMCGLRIGYLFTQDSAIIKQITDIKTHSSMNTNIIGQQMALAAMDTPESYIKDQSQIWNERRDYIYEGLKKLGFSLSKPDGAFYVFPHINDSAQVVSDLFYDHKVIVYDGAWFGAPNHIRLSYALDIEHIQTGLDKIGQYLNQNPGLI